MRAGIPNNTFRVCSGGGPRYPSTAGFEDIDEQPEVHRGTFGDSSDLVTVNSHSDRGLKLGTGLLFDEGKSCSC